MEIDEKFATFWFCFVLNACTVRGRLHRRTTLEPGL